MRVRFASFIFPICAAGVFSWLLWTSIHGERGSEQLKKSTHELTAAVYELAELSESRAALRHRVELMRSESLDPDMLDERARSMLEFSHPDEAVIFLRAD